MRSGCSTKDTIVRGGLHGGLIIGGRCGRGGQIAGKAGTERVLIICEMS